MLSCCVFRAARRCVTALQHHIISNTNHHAGGAAQRLHIEQQRSLNTTVMECQADMLADRVAVVACRCLADKQLHALFGPHVKRDDCAVLSRAQKAVGLIGLQCQLVRPAIVFSQLLGITMTVFRHKSCPDLRGQR